jgi:hypothetical protein
VFESELADVVPVVRTSIGGTRIIGRMCVGNKNGLLLPHTTTDQGINTTQYSPWMPLLYSACRPGIFSSVKFSFKYSDFNQTEINKRSDFTTRIHL